MDIYELCRSAEDICTELGECGETVPESLRLKAAELCGNMKAFVAGYIDLRQFCANSGQPLSITDEHGVVIYVNDAYERQVKFKRADMLGRPEGESIRRPVSAEVIRTGRAVNFGNDGSVRKLESGVFVTGVPINGPDGRLKNVAITLSSEELIYYRYMELQHLMNFVQPVRIEGGDREESEFETFIGKDPQIAALRRLARKVAPTDAGILITGESGTGKELLADCIYELSGRRGKPYIKINCAAIPASLLEAELFGYEKGAFTGANPKGKTGLLEMAEGGTVLLDEIGEFPMELQPKLLRVLQNGEMFKIGGTAPINLDVRIIAATNADLPEKVAQGKFREDLYYRISVIPMNIVPLRERRGDIKHLVRHFVEIYNEKYRRSVNPSPEVMEVLTSYDWPGNIRQLQNIVEYFVICSDDEGDMTTEDLIGILHAKDRPASHTGGGTLAEKRDSYEKQLIQEALAECGSIRKAARKLGVYPSALWRKVQKYGLGTGIEE